MHRTLNSVLGRSYLIEELRGASSAFRFSRALDKQRLHRVTVAGAVFALAEVRDGVVVSPVMVQQELLRAAAELAMPAAAYWPSPTAAQTEEMRQLGVGYISETRGCFLPFMWLSIPPAEWVSKPGIGIRSEAPHLTPCAQVIVLRQLLFGDVAGQTIRGLARILPYSIALMSKAKDELLSHGLCTYPPGTRRGGFIFAENAHDLWLQAEPLLRSPVRHRFGVARCGAQAMLAAGITALSLSSDLADDPLPTFAYYQRSLDGQLQPVSATATELRIEKWSYPPLALIADGAKRVDDLSLYLSLRDNHDPRVRIALESLHLP